MVDGRASHANSTRTESPGASGRGSARRTTVLSVPPGYSGATGTPSTTGGRVKRSNAYAGSPNAWKRTRPSRASVSAQREPGRKAFRCWCTNSSRSASGERFT
jgi:hypothetical protein